MWIKMEKWDQNAGAARVSKIIIMPPYICTCGKAVFSRFSLRSYVDTNIPA
jgi:hypothetical protein